MMHPVSLAEHDGRQQTWHYHPIMGPSPNPGVSPTGFAGANAPFWPAILPAVYFS